MPRQSRLSRRSFIEILAGSSAASAAAPYLAWLPAGASTTSGHGRFAYVASREPGRNGIYAFAIGRDRWSSLQFIPSESPSALALSADQQTLFVANCTRQFQNLPTASVESYRVDSSGRIALISRQPLALSATEPRHLAVSPDGLHLAVAVSGGGSYNLLPISSDGTLGPVSMLRKEIGTGPHPTLQVSSRPGQLSFDSQGHLVTTDLGTDRVSSFRPETDTLRLVERKHAEPGSGPSSLALHPKAGLLFVGNALSGTIQTLRYSAEHGQLGEGTAVSAAPTGSGRHLAALALHPSGAFLFSAAVDGNGNARLATWQTDTAGGSLRLSHELSFDGHIVALASAPDGRVLHALNDSDGTVIALQLDEAAGALSVEGSIASVAKPSAIALKHL